MPKFTIGKYEISTQRIYDALKQCGVKDNATLKKLDTNNDMKISEDELVELLSDEDDDTSKTKTKGTSNSIEEQTMQALQMYDEQNLKLETQLDQLYSQLGTAADMEETNSVLDNIASIQDQIDANRNAVYNLLVQAENQKAAAAQQAAAANGVSNAGTANYNNGFSGLTTGTGIGGGTQFGNTIVSIAQSYAGKLKESDGSYLKVTGGRHEAWCADFVTYVVRQAAKQTGKNINGFGSPSVSNIMAWGQANKCYGSITGMSASQKAQYIANNVKPGDVMIMKSNGASHTGIVTKVYSDGSFETVEGNTSDQCLPRRYKATEARLSGFVKIT